MSAAERPFSVVLQEIVRNVQDIVRSEVRLAKTEVREELTKTRSASLLMALGAASGFFSVLFVLLTVFYALSLVLPAWAAALCVAAGVGIAAWATIRAGLARFKTIHAVAPKTVASVKENVEWAKQQIK
jgi:cytochrome c biogenesis protein CcdA